MGSSSCFRLDIQQEDQRLLSYSPFRNAEHVFFFRYTRCNTECGEYLNSVSFERASLVKLYLNLFWRVQVLEKYDPIRHYSLSIPPEECRDNTLKQATMLSSKIIFKVRLKLWIFEKWLLQLTSFNRFTVT